MLWDDNWGWAWMAMILAMAGFWVRLVWSVATPERDSCDARRGRGRAREWPGRSLRAVSPCMSTGRRADRPYRQVAAEVVAGAGPDLHPGAPSVSPQARRSLQLLWWIPLSPIIGFVLASLILSDSWPLWQIIPLALVLAVPFVIGAAYACAAIRHHDKAGWVGLVVHLAMTAVAIVMPISESMSK